jgi:hypothetical protein
MSNYTLVECVKSQKIRGDQEIAMFIIVTFLEDYDLIHVVQDLVYRL